MANVLKLDDHLCFSIYAAEHAFTRFYKPLLAPLGLTYPQYLVLVALWETDGLALGSIGARLGLDSGTLTPLVRRMETAGLVTRRRDATDERVVRVGLTAKGRRLEARAAGFPQRIAAAARGPASEIATLHRLLVRLRQDLDAAA